MKNLFIVIFLFFSSLIQAQETQEKQATQTVQAEQEIVDPIKVHAASSTTTYFIGEKFHLDLMLIGSNTVSPFQASEFPGFQFTIISQDPILNNKEKAYHIRLALVPLKAGELSIPSQTLVVADKFYETEAISIQVKSPELSKDIKLDVQLSKTDLYVGEPVLATVTWYTSLPLYAFKAVDIEIPILQNASFRVLNSKNEPDPNNKSAIGLPVSQNRIIALRGSTKIDEKEYEYLRFQRVIIPLSAGQFNLGKARLLSVYPDVVKNPQQQKRWRPTYPSFFNNNFFDADVNGNFKKLMCLSSDLQVKVKALPTEGRPADFYGLVGKVDLSVKADNVVLESGSPIKLDIKLSNHAFPEILELPRLDNQLPFTQSFKLLPNKRLGEIKEDTKIFERTIRPIDTDVKLIPAIRIPYFDIESKSYGVAKSDAIAINVTAARELTAFDAIIQGPNKLKNNLEENPDGIRHNNISVDILKPDSLVSDWIWAFLIPPALFLIYFQVTAYDRLFKSNPQQALAIRAYRKFKSQPKAKNTDELDSQIQTYFAHRLNMTAGAILSQDLQLPLKAAIKPNDFDELSDILDSLKLPRFKENYKDNLQLDDLIRRSQKIIRLIERRLPNA
ncbi:BatD family protein [Lentisphaera profundi]|uniref:BatD family protein n=1 Tax=Lentisphaera profundi TaxID=1658616 RepID=A0ABY7VRX3_9BACT|nr:BatD family protein [Lentisphaera profundi]WDE95606.1 BatD family protein [Lentisphaera profundi]